MPSCSEISELSFLFLALRKNITAVIYYPTLSTIGLKTESRNEILEN
jgi:hypothetical protein